MLDDELEVDVPRDTRVILKTRPGVDPVVSERDGRRIYAWHTARLESEREDEKAKEKKPKKNDVRDVRLTTFPAWSAIGAWYGTLERPQKAPSAEVRKKAAELTADRHGDLEKVQALYEYVAGAFRYVSLSFGVGRYQPHAAADVLRNQYGDCKDKHTLLASLIESIGLHASAALVNSHADVDPDFPSPSQFDHVITRVRTGAGDIWLDATAEVAPFRLLMPQLRGKHALVIDNGEGRLEDTPAESPVTHTTDVRVEAALDEAGTLSAKVRLTATGDPELLFRMMFRQIAPADWKTYISRMMNGEGIDGEIGEWKVSDPAALHEPFAVEFHVKAANYVTWTKQLDLRLPFEDYVSLRRADDDADEASFEIGSPRRMGWSMRLELPASYRAQMPLSVSVARDYGEYRSTYGLDARVLTAERTLTVREAKLARERLGDYTAFRRVVTRDLQQAVVLQAAAAVTSVPGELKVEELEKRGREALDQGSYAEAITLLTRVTALDPKHKSAWNSLGRAYLELRQPGAAIDALQKQIGVNAYDLNAYNNLGRAYTQQRKFAEAEAAFEHEIQINPLDQPAHANLGGMYLEWRKYERAAAELEKAIALDQKDATLRIRLGEAYLNLHQRDRAMASFDRAAELDASPRTWNEVAYQLALNKTDLDLGLQYAESAVTSLATASRNFSVDRVTAYGLWQIGELAASWDTLGWVYFAKGDLDRAERFVRASWQLMQNAEVGDHLAQIYEKQGRRDEAIRVYAQALNAERPDERTRERLAALAGPKKSVEEIVKGHGDDLLRERSFAVDGNGPDGASAEFFVLFRKGSIDGVKFIGGDERLRPFAEALRSVAYRATFPDETPTKLLRRGTLSCGSTDGRRGCQFVMALPHEAQLAEQRR